MSDNEDLESISGDSTAKANTLAPLLLSNKVKRDIKDTSVVFYFLRLTPENNNYSQEDVIRLMKDLTIEDVWFISEELSKKGVKHYHCIVWSPTDIREEVKEWLVAKFPGAWKKQDGNKRYNLQVVEDLTKCFTYTSKDGDYLYGIGINPEYITYVNSKSFQKKDTRVGQLLVAREAYLKNKFDDKYLFNVAVDVCIATSSTGSVNMTYVKSFMTGAKAQKDPDYRNKLFDSLNL